MAGLIENGVYRTTVQARHTRGNRLRLFYATSLVFAILALLALLYNIVTGAFGLVALTYEPSADVLMARVQLDELVASETIDEASEEVILEALTEVANLDPEVIERTLNRLVEEEAITAEVSASAQAVLTGENDLSVLTVDQLALLLEQYAEGRLTVVVRETLSGVADDRFTRVPLAMAIDGEVPDEYSNALIPDISSSVRPSVLANTLALNLSVDEMVGLVNAEILQPTIEESWRLPESLFNRSGIEATVEEEYPTAEIQWRSWINPDFLTSPLSDTPSIAGIRPAILGTIWLMIITIIVALPLGVGAAIYLEEYAEDNFLNRLIETNIRNLAGVPSIIYGMLGLAIFVRTFFDFTSGSAFGTDNTSGRTILSAGLTLSLLILPIIIINAQEALRAVPNAIREASYGLGATKWQTTSRQVLPVAIPGIMTGTIIALSRAIGETAPLIVVGASTFISVDPEGPFSRFTALPILIFSWTTEPNDQFRNIAAAAIIILLAMLLTMNSVAIIIRNRTSGKV